MKILLEYHFRFIVGGELQRPYLALYVAVP